MKRIIFTIFLWSMGYTSGFCQSAAYLLQDLRVQAEVADFLYNNTEGKYIFWGYYNLRSNTFTSPREGFTYPREIIPEIEINREYGIINVVIIGNTIIYDMDSNDRLEKWNAINILGEEIIYPEKGMNKFYRKSLEDALEIPSLRDFIAINQNIPREEVERFKFFQLNTNITKSRQARFSCKEYYLPIIYRVEENGKFGIVDRNNNIILPLRYTKEDLVAAYAQTFGEQPDLKTFITNYLENNMTEWLRKDEFERLEDYRLRTGNPTFTNFALSLFALQGFATYQQLQGNILESFTLSEYDATNNTFLVQTPLGEIPVKVRAEFSRTFKDFWKRGNIKIPFLSLKNSPEGLKLTRIDFEMPQPTNPNQTMNFQGYNTLAYHSYHDSKSRGIHIRLKENEDTNITSMSPTNPADVDLNIPETSTASTTTFAVIIGNENYQHEAKVPFAGNDADIFAAYCHKTLGIPEKNIRILKDATLNNIKFQIDWLRQVLIAHEGSAKAIVYYAGHGIPGEDDQSAYLLPADGYGSNRGTGYALKEFYKTLSSAPAKSIYVFLDACFSGTKRESGMMTVARGVAIKVKNEIPKGNMVVFTAAQGDETAYQYADKGHGMFTYFLLKKLQESLGDTTLGELSNYIVSEVKKASIMTNNKIQTPTVIPSSSMNEWEKEKLK